MQLLTRPHAFLQQPASRARTPLAVTCHSQTDRTNHLSRRSLLSGAVLLASPIILPVSAVYAEDAKVLPVSALGSFQRADQREAFRKRAETLLKEELTPEDASTCMSLVLHDAGTYDERTQTGGMDGSVVLSEELDRPENASLKPLVQRLAVVKSKIDAAAAEEGAGAISWADLLVLAGKVSTQKAWGAIKVARAKDKSGGDIIAGAAFGAPWSVQLGRLDNPAAAPAGRIPPAGAPVQEIKAYLLALGAKPNQVAGAGPFTPKPPFWERPGYVIWTAAQPDPAAEEARMVAADPVYKDIQRVLDISRRTLTRTEYEVDFINFYTKLTNLRAKFNPDAYLHPIAKQSMRL